MRNLGFQRRGKQHISHRGNEEGDGRKRVLPCNGHIRGKVPRSDSETLKRSVDAVVGAIDSGFVAACHDVSSGGLASCLAEMVMGGRGAEVCLYSMGDMRTDFKLFSESNTRWVVEVKRGREEEFEALFKGISISKLGDVKGSNLVVYDGDDMKKYIDLEIGTMYER